MNNSNGSGLGKGNLSTTKLNNANSNSSQQEDVNHTRTFNSDEKFKIPGVIRRSPIYGNYFVASRNIKAGEIICEEYPLLTTPYGLSDKMPFCLTCCKDLALSEKCKRCKWPICDNDGKCQNDITHKLECEIFSKNSVSFKGTKNDYGALEVLRALLLKDSDPIKWKTILEFESHSEARNETIIGLETKIFVNKFITITCNLKDYDIDLIDKVLGVLSVNTFWTLRDTNRYASLLFDRVTIFAHDCEPNTYRTIMTSIEFDEKNVPLPKVNFFIRIWASRDITKDEMITIYYTNIEGDVKARQEYLKESFYFDCQCNRCIRELLEESLKIENVDGVKVDDERFALSI